MLEEGVIGGRPVADEEGKVGGEGAFLRAELVSGKSFALEAEGAQAEPLVLGHFLDEDLLGDVGGLVMGGEVFEETFEFGGSSPGMRMVLEQKPQERLFLEDLALPSELVGPLDFSALARLAAICLSVAIVDGSFRVVGEKARLRMWLSLPALCIAGEYGGFDRWIFYLIEA